jgi:hypothetical protein
MPVATENPSTTDATTRERGTPDPTACDPAALSLLESTLQNAIRLWEFRIFKGNLQGCQPFGQRTPAPHSGPKSVQNGSGTGWTSRLDFGGLGTAGSHLRTDKLQQCPGAGIAQSWRRQLENPGVASRPIDKPGSDLLENDAGCLLVAQQLHNATTGSHCGRYRLRPLGPLPARSPLLPLGRIAVRRGPKRTSLLERYEAPFRDRDAPFHQRPHLLGLGHGGDDPSGYLRCPNFPSFGLALSEHQGGSKIPQQRPLMRGTTAKNAAFMTVTHGVILDSLRWIQKLVGKDEKEPHPHSADASNTTASGLGTGGQLHAEMHAVLPQFAFDLLQRGLAEIP